MFSQYVLNILESRWGKGKFLEWCVYESGMCATGWGFWAVMVKKALNWNWQKGQKTQAKKTISLA